METSVILPDRIEGPEGRLGGHQMEDLLCVRFPFRRIQNAHIQEEPWLCSETKCIFLASFPLTEVIRVSDVAAYRTQHSRLHARGRKRLRAKTRAVL